MKSSIQRKLPVFVTVLLLAVAVAQLTIGYGKVRQASRALADQRLPLATKVLADLLQIPQGRARITALARNPAIVAFLRSGGRTGREPALAAMRELTSDTATTAALELRDFGGKLLLRTGRFTIADSVLVSPAKDSARYGPLIRQDSTLFLAVTAAAGDGERAGGIVQQVGRVVFNAQTPKNLTGLAGGDISLLVGNASGDPWTDFGAIVPAPPQSVLTSRVPIRYERGGEMKRAAAAPVPGTPWMVVAEMPSRLVIAPARTYLVTMAPIAALIVIVGALVAWWGSRRLTTPLADVTRAAEAIASGDLEQHVPEGRDDELGRLARSFNTMAGHVARSHHRLEAQVAQRTEALEGTNAELESFSYSVSHDLRAPLRAIHGFARILLEDHNAKLDPEAQRLLGVIDQNTRRMGQLIDDLLAFSRLGRQGITAGRVDMKELARTVADEVRSVEAEAERKGSLEIRIDPLPVARGDRALVRQVISNLLQNAVKFSRGRDNARVEVGSRADGGQTVYFVKDNGAGFDPRYSDKLFGVFQRLHSAEQFEGTGVGLAIVKRIVQRHGGRVWAEGQVDQGATFYFTLPGEEN
ncbi:MAG TPA: ATP-binding protein [Gemmatimonadales bacterium]|nr:ATP-binding protein [Gemmatimonadales bacterium]